MAILVESEQGTVNETLTVSIDPNYPHIFVGVSYFTDGTYTTTVTPTAGTLDVGVRLNGNTGYTAATSSPIDCTDNTAYAESGLTANSVKVSPNVAILGATHYQITVNASST